MASNTFDSFKKYASSYIDVIIYAYEINFLKISRQLLEVLTVGRKSAAPCFRIRTMVYVLCYELSKFNHFDQLQWSVSAEFSPHSSTTFGIILLIDRSYSYNPFHLI